MNPMIPMTASRPRRVPSGLALAGLALAALALTACGGSTAEATATTTAAPGGAGGQDVEAYRSCLAEHGVTLPSGGAGQPPGAGASGMPAPPDGMPSGGPGGMPSGMPSGMPGGGPSGRPSGGPGGMPGGPGGGSGLPLPDGVDADTYAAAQQACQDLLPTGWPGGGTPPSGAALPDDSALWAFRSCLADHGVTLAATAGPDSLDRTDAEVQAALRVCEVLLPSAVAAPGGPPAPTTSPSAAASASPALATT